MWRISSRIFGIEDGCQKEDDSVNFAVAQLGARMHYAVPNILNRAEMLDRFFTDWHSPKWLASLAAPLSRWYGGAARVVGRRAPDVPSTKIRANLFLAVRYAALVRRKRAAGMTEEAYLWAADKFPQWVARVLDQEGWPSGIYAFNTAARDLFSAAEKRGTVKILEQTIAPADYERELVAEAARRFPEWGWGSQVVSSAQQELDSREKEEWSLADHIICGSEFVANALRMRGVAAEKLSVIPYGIEGKGGEIPSLEARPPGPLRVLFAGAVGLRKGAPVLIGAAQALRGSVEITLAGRWDAPSHLIRKLPKNVRWLGAVPRAAMEAHYRSHDVLVLPSVCEGSATVCYEAVSHGLPIITTANSGFPVVDGVSGFLIATNDFQALADRLQKLYASPELLLAMSNETLRSRDEYTLEAYGKRLLALLASAPWQRHREIHATMASQG